MLHQVKCTNCGANIDNAGTDRFIKCEYCGSSFGNFTPFGEFDIVASRVEHNDSDTLKLLALSFKMKDDDNVLKLSDRLLEKNLCDWIAQLVQRNCLILAWSSIIPSTLMIS